jgi:predicted phage tail component-like protein
MNPAAILFGSVDLYEQWGVIVTRRPWPYMPKPRVFIENFGDASGAAVAGTTFDPRYFEVECAIEDNENLENVLDAIASHFANMHANGGLQRLVFGYRPNVQWQARQIAEIKFESALNGAVFNLTFISPDPVGTPYEDGS